MFTPMVALVVHATLTEINRLARTTSVKVLSEHVFCFTHNAIIISIIFVCLEFFTGRYMFIKTVGLVV